MNCPTCSVEVSANSKYCSACGSAVGSESDITVESTSAPPSPFRPSRGASASVVSVAREHGRFLPGTRIGDRYRMVSLLGRGGMGEVYRADDLRLGHPVALKFLPRSMEANLKRQALFLNEVKLARQVSHPNVCRVYDLGEAEGQHFISMEFVDGEDLKGLLRQIGRFPKDKGLEIVKQLCAGLAAAHAQGVVHRDLKPSNIMIDGRGQVRIMDFGLACLADEDEPGSSAAGTPTYMAPEQLFERRVTAQSDIYSLGLIFYEMFTGRAVHEGESVSDIIEKRREGTALRRPSALVRDLDPIIDRIVGRCLEERPERRPQAVSEVGLGLPERDPIAAALAAGDTPSPEMVAAAGQEGRLTFAMGGILLGLMLTGLAGLALLTDRYGSYDLTRLPLKPDQLEFKAQEMLAVQGYFDRSHPPLASAWGFELPHGRSPKGAGPPGEIHKASFEFWYRQSSRYFRPSLPDLWLGGSFWDVSPRNPPPFAPGMIGLRMDSSGRLREWLAVPPVGSDVQGVPSQPSWEGLFASAGLGLTNFVERPPEDWIRAAWKPPVFAREIRVWSGKAATGDDTDVVGAADRGRPISFRVTDRGASDAWFSSARPAASDRPAVAGTWGYATSASFSLISIGTLIFCALLAIRNLQLGRSDRKGTKRCVLYYVAIELIIWIFAVHHVPSADRELPWAANYVIRSIAYGFQFLIYYLALEPYVRRIWPRSLISWTRIIAGRLLDPLVGRDILIGCVFALGLAYSGLATAAAVNELRPDTVIGVRYLVATFLESHQQGLIGALSFMAVMLFFRVLLRNSWLAGAAFALFWTLIISSGSTSPWVWGHYFVFSVASAVVVLRFGLVAMIAYWFVWYVLVHFPITSHIRTWYAQPGLFATGVVGLLATYGFLVSSVRIRSVLQRGGEFLRRGLPDSA